MSSRTVVVLSILLSSFALCGCQQIARVAPGSTWHQKFGWNAEDYFADPQVIALCKAIEANDLAEIDRLVASGANMNAKGKGNMTPLLWAYPDNQLPRFKYLLENGADPNVVIDSDFNTSGGMSAGDSVTHLASRTSFPGYFDAVFDHGGDPDFIRNWLVKNQTPLFSVITGASADKINQLKRLIKLGANLDQVDSTGTTPTMQAVARGYYNLALLILEAGAKHRIQRPKSNSRLIHNVLADERRSNVWTPQQRTDYDKLLKWFEEHGESIEQAKADRNRWESWSITTGEYQRKMAQEVAEREAREAREKQGAEAKLTEEQQASDTK